MKCTPKKPSLSKTRINADAYTKRPQTPEERTLEEALQQTLWARWHKGRSRASNYSQARLAIEWLQEQFGARLVRDVTPQMVQALRDAMRSAGYASTSINRRLSCLSAMGISGQGSYVRLPRKLKWWLRPDEHAKLTAWLRTPNMARSDLHRTQRCLVADYIDWTSVTGLRIEESLALVGRHFVLRDGQWEVEVSGTKTLGAHATLPLGPVAVAILECRGPLAPDDRLFPISYSAMKAIWIECRSYLGLDPSDTTATLKALRRNAARYLHIDRGMPLDMVRQYLRHDSLSTTLGYLRLTGGYASAEMRRYF